MQYVGLSVAGPRSRALLQSVVREDLSSAAFPFLSFRRLDVGMIPALVGRISFTGDLGYEIWVTTEYQRALYDLLMGAGAEQGLKLFGGRALNSLRIERKSTRLNSSHSQISYAVFCLKKKKNTTFSSAYYLSTTSTIRPSYTTLTPACH